MKLNKKGFTLIEILAVVVKLGLLTSVAISGTMRYLEKTREKAYEALEQTLHSAAENYIIDRGVLVPTTGGLTLTSAQLIETGFIKELDDPAGADDNKQCTGTVKVTRSNNTGSKLDEYTYEVRLQCSAYTSTRTFNS